MAKKKRLTHAQMFQKPDKAAKRRELVKKFQEDVADAILNAAAAIGADANRIPFTGYTIESPGNEPESSEEAGEKSNFTLVGLFLTDGFAGMLPALSEQERAAYNEKYYKRMREIRETAGDDLKSWSIEDHKRLHNGEMLIFNIMPLSIGADRAVFSLNSLWTRSGQDRDIVFRDVARLVDGEMVPYVLDIENNAEELLECVVEEIRETMFESWLLARDRKIRNFIHDLGGTLDKELDAWSMESVTHPSPGFSLLLYVSDAQEISEHMPESPVKTACLDIVGDFFRPGVCAAFVADFDISGGKNVLVTLRGPFPYNPLSWESLGEKIAPGKECEILFQAEVPGSCFRDLISGTDSEKDWDAILAERAEDNKKQTGEIQRIANGILNILAIRE